jgi:hypothetical protein
MIIDVHATKEVILSLPQYSYKVLEQSEDSKGVVLATPIDDNFTRTMIVINSSSIGIAVQSPDEKGLITLLFKQVPLELINLLVTKESEPEVASDTEGKE